jgi:hypothetical protein
MKIRALANGNVIEAHEDAAKILIENGIYEKVDDKEPTSAEASSPPPMAEKPAKRRKAR